MGAKAAPAARADAELYVGRDDITKEKQARPAAETLYAMPAQVERQPQRITLFWTISHGFLSSHTLPRTRGMM